MVTEIKNKFDRLETASFKITEWIGTPYSIVIHTLLFGGIFFLDRFGLNINQILLILTTAVSLEAIYLAIFIQMTVNRQAASLESVKDDIEDIEEDVEELAEDAEADDNMEQTLKNIETQIQKIQKSLDLLKKKGLL